MPKLLGLATFRCSSGLDHTRRRRAAPLLGPRTACAWTPSRVVCSAEYARNTYWVTDRFGAEDTCRLTRVHVASACACRCGAPFARRGRVRLHVFGPRAAHSARLGRLPAR